jgi:bacterioferritin-associated ferredoxin
MIACLCRGLSEAAVQNVIESGASSLRQIAEACGAGTDCGACCPMVQELLACAQTAR